MKPAPASRKNLLLWILFAVPALFWVVTGWSPEPGYFKIWDGVRPIWSDVAHGLPRIWSGEVSLSATLLCIAYLGACCVLGWRFFISPFLLQGRANIGLLALFSGFLPGYLFLAPANRIVSFMLPNRQAALLELAAAGAGAAWVLVQALRRGAGPGTAAGTGAKFRMFRAQLRQLWIIPAWAAVAVWSLSHVTGDATGFTFQAIFANPTQFPAPFGQLPMFGQHYDELCFLHPVLYSGLYGTFSDLLTPYWLLGSVARTSVATLAYLCARRMGIRGWEAGAVGAFLLLSPIGINPAANWEFIDSAHPFAITAHPARVLGGIAPLLVAAVHLVYLRRPRRASLVRALPAAFVLGLGAVSLSIHVFLTLVLAGILCVLFLRNRDEGQPAERSPALVLPLGTLVVLPLAYARSLPAGMHHWIWILACALVTGLLLHRRGGLEFLKTSLRSPLLVPKILRAGAWLFGAAIGLLFLGNLLAPKIGFHKSLGVELLSRNVPPGGFALGLINTALPAVANVLWSAASPRGFIAAFGLPLLLSACVFYLHALRREQRPAHLRLLGVVECLSLGLLGSILLFHFMGGGVDFWLSLWVRSRFTEGWFYGLAAASLCALFKGLPAPGRRALGAALLVWAALPWSGLLQGTLGPQVVANFRWMLKQF